MILPIYGCIIYFCSCYSTGVGYSTISIIILLENCWLENIDAYLEKLIKIIPEISFILYIFK